METKICTKCKRELDISCFGKRKARKNKPTSWCKYCYREYNRQHKEQHAVWWKCYHKQNKDQLDLYYKQYREKHREEKMIYGKHYRANNFEALTKKAKIYNNKKALFKTYFKRLGVFEEIRKCSENLEVLQVKCSYCGKWMIPTNSQVSHRIQAFDGTISGDCRFYCSENCKESCPIFYQKKYQRGFKKITQRKVSKEFITMVLEIDQYTCQMCGAIKKNGVKLHVHHIVPYTINPMLANDIDNCITLCKKCHKEVHSQDGCNYNDLKCEET